VKEPTKLTGINLERLVFKPIIVQCSEIDADVMLDELKKDIDEGKPVNELKLVYLPLFRSIKLNPTELFKESTKLIRSLNIENQPKQKALSLAILISGKVVDPEVLRQIYKEVKLMSTGNVILDVAEEYGEKRGIERHKEETARKMLYDGLDVLDIIRYTGIDAERLSQLRESVRSEAV